MRKLRKELREWTKALIIALTVVLVLNIFITPTVVFSISMNPTLVEKDVLILQKSSTFNRGDIVSFKSDLVLSEHDLQKLNPIQRLTARKNPQKNLIKRIIALPGDSIFIEKGNVFVNGKKLDEPFIGSATTGSIDIKRIPENEYFLMGDNRSHSTDSRSEMVGTISKDRIIGKAMFRVYPLNKIGVVK